MIEKIFELRMMSHKIKQMNAPLRFTKAVFVCLRLIMPVLHLKEKVHMHLKIKLENYQSKHQAINIPLNTKSWNDLKMSLADCLKKYCFRRHIDMDNSLSHSLWNWTSSHYWLMVGLFNYAKFIDVPPIPRTSMHLGQFGSLG